MDVDVLVGKGVGVSEGSGEAVGSRESSGAMVGIDASAVSVPKTFAASAVKAITVGRYSGG